MSGSAAAEPTRVPAWEERYPGRMAYELARLKERGAQPVVDPDALARGVLALDLVWLVEGKEVPLRAVFPAGFPRLRPNVSLTGDPALFPERHCNPIDGGLCLLGRDTAQWLPSWTLARLLDAQLKDALTGGGDEDPQGEPAEVWWNGFGLIDSYVLVDSSWDIKGAREGTLQVRYTGKGGRSPQIQAVIKEVREGARAPIASFTNPLPDHLRGGKELAVPWVRVDGTFLPKGFDAPQVQQLLQQHPPFRGARPRELLTGLHGFMVGIVYTMEVGFEQKGDGWMLGLLHGPRKSFGPKATRSPSFNTIPTMRAGLEDTGSRVPAITALRNKKIALFGLGAIGAPLALELARNGCSELRILDHDTVEPGNSVRWPIGTPAWGRKKTNVLHEFVKSNYPGCTVVSYLHAIGRPDSGDDDGVLRDILEGVDIAIDATAAYGVTTLIHDYASERGVQLISLWATPTVEGGVVARYARDSGCPVCLEYYHQEGGIVPPPGLENEGRLVQPPGCAERTFSGGSFDLQELSLEAFRVVLDCLTAVVRESCVETLTLSEAGQRIPPLWRVDPLPKHDKCSCTQR